MIVRGIVVRITSNCTGWLASAADLANQSFVSSASASPRARAAYLAVHGEGLREQFAGFSAVQGSSTSPLGARRVAISAGAWPLARASFTSSA